MPLNVDYDATYIIPELTDKELKKLAHLLVQATGIMIQTQHREMVRSRLAGRMSRLKCRSFLEYTFNLGEDPQEFVFFVDAMTTNETYFFRELSHFDFLRQTIIPEVRGQRTGIKIWSAACSEGQEVYSLAMCLDQTMGLTPWFILGSDVSQACLEKARKGVYPMTRIETLPRDYLERYCLRGSGPYDGYFMVQDFLRAKVKFEQINLIRQIPDVGIFNVIFLRNVLIYFDQETQNKIIAQVVKKLKPGGYFFTSLTERIDAKRHGFLTVSPSIYQKK